MLPEVFKFEQKTVRTIVENNEPWFCATDVCAVLGYRNAPDAIQKHCKTKGIAKRDTLSEGGEQSMIFINEPNLYRLIIKSRKPEAEPFEKWVMETVLPTIRKTGQYSAAPAIEVPKTLAQALALAAKVEEQREKLALTVQVMTPKAKFHDDMMKCDDGQSINESAKILNTGEKRLFAWLRGMGYLMSDNRPYQKYIDQGLFKLSERMYKDKDRNERVYTVTLITPKGLKYFNEKLNPQEVA